jgi:hypothetical protein
MKLSIVSFADSGSLQKERVVFRATSNANVGDYMVLCSESTETGAASSGAHIAFWFPDDEVKEGDLIVLYTKSGNESKKDIGGGHTAYFYYWGNPKPVWNSATHALVLIETGEYIVESLAQTVEPKEDKGA